MSILDFFRRRKREIRFELEHPTTELDLKQDIADDPYNGKIASAILLRDAGRDEEAEVLLKQILEEKEEHVRAWFILAEHYVDQNEVGRALYCLEKVVQYQPTNQSVKLQINQLRNIVRKRPDYLWEYNQERGLI